MIVTQEALRIEFLRRLCRTWENGPPPGDLEDLGARAARCVDCVAVAVLRQPDVRAFARSALRFAFALEPSIAARWLQAYTRTVFVLGNPANLAARFPFVEAAHDRSVSWLGPVPKSQTTALLRLLKPVPANGGPMCGDAGFVHAGDVPPSGRAHTLYVASERASWADYFIHLNHTLVEAALTGVLHPGDAVRIENVVSLSSLSPSATFARIHFDRDDREQLRLYTTLVTN